MLIFDTKIDIICINNNIIINNFLLKNRIKKS